VIVIAFVYIQTISSGCSYQAEKRFSIYSVSNWASTSVRAFGVHAKFLWHNIIANIKKTVGTFININTFFRYIISLESWITETLSLKKCSSRCRCHRCAKFILSAACRWADLVANETIATKSIRTFAIPAARKLNTVGNLSASVKTNIVALVDVNAVKAVAIEHESILAIAGVISVTVVTISVNSARFNRIDFAFVDINADIIDELISSFANALLIRSIL